MKSSTPGSAQCRSSKTSTSGRRSATASKNRRHAVNDSSRCSPGSPSSPTSGRRCASSQRASAWPGSASTAVRELRRGFLVRVAGQDPGLRAGHLGERREGDAVAVGETAAAEPCSRARAPPRWSRRARGRAGSCRSRERRRARRVAACAPAHADERVAQVAQLLPAADERRRRPRCVVAEPERLPGRNRLALALRVDRRPSP